MLLVVTLVTAPLAASPVFPGVSVALLPVLFSFDLEPSGLSFGVPLLARLVLPVALVLPPLMTWIVLFALILELCLLATSLCWRFFGLLRLVFLGLGPAGAVAQAPILPMLSGLVLESACPACRLRPQSLPSPSALAPASCLEAWSLESSPLTRCHWLR